MQTKLLFIGKKFIYNKNLQEYVRRKVEQKVDYISAITFYKEGDNSLFLYLEEEFEKNSQLIIVTTKQNFSTLGKLLSTITSDNQVLKENILVPQKSTQHEDGSYLLNYKEIVVNAIHIDEMQKLPNILLDIETKRVSVHLFEEDIKSLKALLDPISQMHEVIVDYIFIASQWIQLNISSKKYGNITQFVNAVKQLYANSMIENENIAQHIIERLSLENKKITFAESCTGGLLAYYFTKENGASTIFDGSLVTYSNELKENWLAIESELVEKYGAVSYEVVREMSDGALNVSHADFALSISGIAGDGGGSDEKPVGTVFIGVRSNKGSIESMVALKGDRNYIQKQSVLEAVNMLLLFDKKLFF